jgi:hypothetical protein
MGRSSNSGMALGAAALLILGGGRVCEARQSDASGPSAAFRCWNKCR